MKKIQAIRRNWSVTGRGSGHKLRPGRPVFLEILPIVLRNSDADFFWSNLVELTRRLHAGSVAEFPRSMAEITIRIAIKSRGSLIG